MTGVRVRAEGLSITSKSVVTFIVLLLDVRGAQASLALLAFAIGQLAYATTLFLVYISHFGTGPLWPKADKYVVVSFTIYHLLIDHDRRDGLLDGHILKLALTMMSQSVIKHFLTEGDKMVLSWYSPLRDQGGYAIAVNYGQPEQLPLLYQKLTIPLQVPSLPALFSSQLKKPFAFSSRKPSPSPIVRVQQDMKP